MSVLGSGQFYGEISSRRERAGVSVSCLQHRQPRRLPIHVHRQAYFSMTLAGSYREESGRRSIEYETLTIVFHPPGTAHVDEIGPSGARFLMIEIDDALVQGDELPGELASGYPIELARNASWLALKTLSEEPETASSITLELLGLACGTKAVPRGAPAWLPRVLDRVQDEYLSPLTTRELAASVGVHPVHLARVVRRETGMSLTEIVRRRRVERAARMLGDDESLASISLRCGFADQPHFTRSFRKETGMTPGEMRRLLRS